MKENSDSREEHEKWNAVLTEGPVGRTLFRLTVPMVAGILGMVAFNLTDTFFVSRLGTKELAALSFTFPVVVILNRIGVGLGTGASSVISRAVGRGDRREVQRLTTDSLGLAVVVVAVFAVIGLLTMDQIFTLLGADGDILPMVRTYMKIWYCGLLFVVFPMTINSAMRANGDSKTPAALMMIAVTLNVIIDPLLIYGMGPFPRLELAGAALATVITRAAMMIISFYVVYFRKGMITLERPRVQEVLDSWRRILYVGFPAAATRVIVPLGVGIVTGMVSSRGPRAVAAYGVAVKLEFFALAVVFALSSILGPFVGQNWGAGRVDRLRKGIKLSRRFAFLWGLGAFAALALSAGFIASLFSRDEAVVSGIVLYTRIAAAGYCMLGTFVISALVLNVLHKPYHGAALAVGQTFLMTVPMAWIGGRLFGLAGIFGGIGISYFFAALAAWIVLQRVVKNLEERG
jgi:putative MATE family efflux protein